MNINALVTGSRKYGSPRRDSDTDVVLFVSPETYEDVWSRLTTDENGSKCIFDQVGFVQNENDEASVVWGLQCVDVYCNMSEFDRDILGGLHKWVKVKGSQAFTSTLRNNNVNIIPIFDPVSWAIWLDGTEALAALGEPVNREDAIDFFSSLGMLRFDS